MVGSVLSPSLLIAGTLRAPVLAGFFGDDPARPVVGEVVPVDADDVVAEEGVVVAVGLRMLFMACAFPDSNPTSSCFAFLGRLIASSDMISPMAGSSVGGA